MSAPTESIAIGGPHAGHHLEENAPGEIWCWECHKFLDPYEADAAFNYECACGSTADLMAVTDARGRFDYWRCQACVEAAAERDAERWHGGGVRTMAERQVEARRAK